ncbi:MAG TPA: carboxypeptidase-like regulatory domain-containing protein [Terriglobales bacterium]|nr:carboxypeptidase-like regulatory domain-containing protein [Terriglobales bacterium]
MLRAGKLLSIGLLLLFLSSSAWSQGIFATLTGVVTDPSQSVVPNAKVTLTDVGSGSERQTVTNANGFYTFASVPVGTYSLTIEAQGFKTHKEAAIRLGGGDQRNVNVALAVGGSTETVEVSGVQDFTTAPADSGEKSFTLETKELQNFTQVGSNAAEYIKIVPGFGINNGTSNKSSYRGTVIGINANGDGGDSQSPLNNNFSYNGLPTNSLDITADGAHVSDPGCNCDTPVNPNSDFLQEFKVLTSNFSAEEQKGPVVITSVTKSGGTTYHGSAFFSARNHALNSNDWLNNFSGIQQPANSFYYPGGTFGGPVPKMKNKLFFWTGFEYYHQTLDTGLLRATVPCSSMLGGDFSNNSILTCEGNKTAAGRAPNYVTSNNNWTSLNGSNTTIPVCAGTPNGTCIDPNMLALAKLYPAPNADPNSNGGFNYVQAQIFNQNDRQWTSRVDYSISDNTKVFVRYNYQREIQLFPVGLWWRNGDQVPYPTPIQGKNKSDSWAGTITHVFSPSMTNETVMAYTFVGFPNVFADPKKVDRTNVGYSYAGVFGNGVSQIPSFGNSGEAALVFNPGGFEAGGASQGLYANKWMPSISDTLTKVVGTHTLKGGFFYEWIRNAQPANNNTNGNLSVSSGSTTSFGNEYADLLTGNLSNYNETNFNRINDISYNTWEFFGQDSWKATRKLTLEFGLRATHFTPWVDDENFGYSIFNKSLYDPTGNGACAQAPTFCGFVWHAKDKSVPLGGFPTRALLYQPRFGAAYDVIGNGNTVLRGGWGRFFYHSGQFTNGLDASAGVATANISPSNWVGGTGCPTNAGGSPLFASSLGCLNVAATPASPAAVDAKDDKQPYTDSWSFTVSQRTPWESRLEVAYVGNRSRDLANAGGFGSNINLVPLGSMLTASNPATANANTFRPLQGYGDINQATNNAYANYNALQVTWGRHAGRLTMQANYTWQKALGIVLNNANGQSNGSISINPFDLRSNYGVQPTDRRNLFNYAYSIDLGNPMHAHGVLEGITGGWQLSGILQLQSGANITEGGGYNSSTNYHMSLTCVTSDPTAPGHAGTPCPQSAAIIPGSISAQNPQGIAINNQSILGTNAVQLNPLVTCNPNSGRSSHQFVNGSCFAAPTVVGQNGPTLLPVSYGPAYFNWDMSIFKNFKISESKNLQFRINGYNFLNHPLYSFPDASNLTLQFVQDPANGYAITQTNSNFGKTTVKQGQRIVEFAVKFYF